MMLLFDAPQEPPRRGEFESFMPLCTPPVLPFNDKRQHVVNNADREYEDAFSIDNKFWNLLGRHFEHCGIKQEESVAHSLYLDTQHLDVFSGGFTLRYRAGGTSSKGSVYENQFGLILLSHLSQAPSRYREVVDMNQIFCVDDDSKLTHFGDGTEAFHHHRGRG